MKKTVLATVLWGISAYSFAQSDENWKLFPGKSLDTLESSSEISLPEEIVKDSNRIGYLEIVQDERIKALLEKNTRINEQKQTIPGFRVQLFSGSGEKTQSEANKIKGDFLKLYEEVPAIVYFDNPNWKTRVGDYRTKLEAEKFLSQIQNEFPNSFVVKDQINFPELDK